MSGMIRRLRWKIVGISMLFVTLVLAAVFTGVMLTTRSSLEQSSTPQGLLQLPGAALLSSCWDRHSCTSASRASSLI